MKLKKKLIGVTISVACCAYPALSTQHPPAPTAVLQATYPEQFNTFLSMTQKLNFYIDLLLQDERCDPALHQQYVELRQHLNQTVVNALASQTPLEQQKLLNNFLTFYESILSRFETLLASKYQHVIETFNQSHNTLISHPVENLSDEEDNETSLADRAIVMPDADYSTLTPQANFAAVELWLNIQLDYMQQYARQPKHALFIMLSDALCATYRLLIDYQHKDLFTEASKAKTLAWLTQSKTYLMQFQSIPDCANAYTRYMLDCLLYKIEHLQEKIAP